MSLAALLGGALAMPPPASARCRLCPVPTTEAPATPISEAVRIDLPSSIALHGLRGGTIRLDSLVTDLPAQPRLDSQGSLHFRFGGALHIQGNVEGDFRGDVPITVDYL